MAKPKDKDYSSFNFEDYTFDTDSPIISNSNSLAAPLTLTDEDIKIMKEYTDAFKHMSEIQNRRREKMKQKEKIIKHPGVVLRRRRSGVEWEVIGIKEVSLPDYIYFDIETKVKYSIIKSKNSGQKRIISINSVNKYDVIHIPEAAKILYGWTEDE